MMNDKIVLMLWISMKLTVYFRRKFDWTKYSTLYQYLVNLLYIGIFIIVTAYCQKDDNNIRLRNMCNGLLLASIIFEMRFCLVSTEEKLKSLYLTCSLYLANSEAGSIAVLTWTSTCVIATTQLLRWPPAMKVYLRTLRTICGPSYTILVIGACYKESLVGLAVIGDCTRYNAPASSPSFLNIRLPTLLEIAAVTSFVASIFFRPDNHSTRLLLSSCSNQLRLLLRPRLLLRHRERQAILTMVENFKSDKLIHAGLMILSYLCMIAKFLSIDYDSPFRSLGILFIALSLLGLVCGTTPF